MPTAYQLVQAVCRETFCAFNINVMRYTKNMQRAKNKWFINIDYTVDNDQKHVVLFFAGDPIEPPICIITPINQ